MLKHYRVLNIKCQGCASSVKKALLEEFGEVEVDLSVEPRVISLEVNENFDEDKLRIKMKKLGYPFDDEELGKIEEFGTKAKSFVSCAIGKMDNDN